MASPLCLSSTGVLNFTTPPTNRQVNIYNISSHTPKMSSEHVASDTGGSSPVLASQAHEEKDKVGQSHENFSPSKSRHSRILSGTELSPLKILISKENTAEEESPTPRKLAAAKSPRKISPEKRFPVKINSSPSPTPIPETQKHQVKEHHLSIDEALLRNEGLATAIKIFEDDDTTLDDGEDNEVDTSSTSIGDQPVGNESLGPDDTMISTLSNFSAVPNMTMFARIGHSPTKFANTGSTPLAMRSKPEPSPLRTPRPPTMHESGNTTNLLMDFTEQMGGFSSRYVQQTPNRSQSFDRNPRHSIAATPQRQQSNLLDFDIPPLPTPRSIPTVTPRELESLKSGFLSEISSLKASLSGKEAEVLALKTAVGDAEKRVGESMEQVREERAMKEAMTEERENWEARSREMETVLRKVKEEIVKSQREREELESKLDESEKRREAAEIMAQEAESKMAGMRAGKATSEAESGNKSPDKTRNTGSREVEIAVERVARELHVLYKSKHEAKVAALKKSYESRWEKKVHELESRIEGLAEENEKLRLDQDVAMNRVDPDQTLADEERKVQAIRNSAQIKEMGAEIEKLEAVIDSIKMDNHELRQLLEKERVEKGELVILAEELMSMQTFVQAEPPRPPPSQPTVTKTPHARPENFRNSIGSRPSGLRAPGSVKKPTESRIGGIAHDRSRNGGSQGGLPRPGSGTAMRSGIMSSIEKMGNYRSRGE
ncbi:central kinetochore-associated-domain-containing protein [Daldinia decipiens]|uniref:central kinetochore-associated-domain-containing protein n=1 Tax=Daldinia decipiens TaxID=326647 RepID=UPI0020C4DE75|nr:central kinetochore-associated-domain-containing protein [Daldinia decipiens]KAI1657226.1 central kinetochore-associated-domain-containing protein [Daldinia decipiens]